MVVLCSRSNLVGVDVGPDDCYGYADHLREAAVGMLQAADKNSYAPSLPIFETCATDATHVCSCIYKVTPKWDRVDILLVLANRPLNEPEPDE